jgi:hypothetical protein
VPALAPISAPDASRITTVTSDVDVPSAESDAGSAVIDAVCASSVSTETAAVLLTPSTMAVMDAVPTPADVTSPVASTVATIESEELHSRDLSASAAPFTS